MGDNVSVLNVVYDDACETPVGQDGQLTGHDSMPQSVHGRLQQVFNEARQSQYYMMPVLQQHRAGTWALFVDLRCPDYQRAQK